jgi:hypothetical protein
VTDLEVTVTKGVGLTLVMNLEGQIVQKEMLDILDLINYDEN